MHTNMVLHTKSKKKIARKKNSHWKNCYVFVHVV